MRGRFKFNVYNSGGLLTSSSDYVNNFITTTGLCFPSYYAFADCFRYISLGLGTGANAITGGFNNWGTTGLQTSIPAYGYIGGRDCSNTSQYEPDACGYVESGNGLILSRAWRVPASPDFFDQTYHLGEFMVSPGRPYIVGIDGSKACSCSETTSDGFAGMEGATITNFYTNPTLCDGCTAFSRVLKNITVNVNDYMVISYELILSFNTGLQTFALNVTSDNQSTNWSGIASGKASIVHHGLKLINNGTDISARTQIDGYSFANDYGESYVPSWGCPLEPSTISDNLQAYISTDNLQFCVNNISGGKLGNLSKPVPFGVMGWRSRPSLEVVDGFDQGLINIRQDGSNTVYPDPTNYKNANITADSLSFDVSFGLQSVPIAHTPLVTPFVQSGRSRTSIYAMQFWGISKPFFLGEPIRSVVLGYSDSDHLETIYPAFDVVFSDLTGGFIRPNVGSPFHYSVPIDTNPSTHYFYLENGGILTFSFNMSWSSPCESGVIGC